MYGAILGDIIGSRFEGRSRAIKTKDFELFAERSHFTDDTVLTVAVANALLNIRTSEKIVPSEELKKSLHDWGNKYLHAGYSRRFKNWLLSENPQPYGGYTNGAAMRVSPAGWLFDSLDETINFAKISAAVSHDTAEGMNGAASVASAIFLARNGATKDEIKSFIESNFNYNLSRTLDEIRPEYSPKFACSESVPEAIISFLEAKDFEDAVRNAISLGGDADTQADIAGSIAQAFFGVPHELKIECRKRLPSEMIQILDRFNAEVFGENAQELFDDIEILRDSKTFEDLTPLKELLIKFIDTDSEKLSEKVKETIGYINFYDGDAAEIIDEKISDNVRLFTGDITKLKVDAIINSVNSHMQGGKLSKAIHRAAGSKLAETCRKITEIKFDAPKITEGFDLPAKYVIHAVSPQYNYGGINDALALIVCYKKILELAQENNLHSVAFPAISTGARGFPEISAAGIATASVCSWLKDNYDYNMRVVFVNLNEKGTEIYKNQLIEYFAED